MGVCMIPILNENKTEENKGIRLDAFFYSGKNIISLSIYNKKKEQTFSLIATMSEIAARNKGWMGQTKRDKKNKDIYMQDKLRFIPGIAAQIEARLENAGITSVQELAVLDDMSLNTISSITRLSTKRLKSFRNLALKAKEGNSIYPKNFDFRTADNPFEARYGNEWEKKYLSSTIAGQVLLAQKHHFHQHNYFVCLLLQSHEAMLNQLLEPGEAFALLPTKHVHEFSRELEGCPFKLHVLSRGVR